MKHILIVDDNIANLIAAKNAIASIYKTTVLSSGEEALLHLQKSRPDLILLDINMPGMDGFEVMESLKKDKDLCNIPIIFLTADDDAETESKCLENGARDFIRKPFVPAVMRSRIGRILELEDLRKSLASRLDEKTKEASVFKSKSQQDTLTGLWNRTYTEEKVDDLLKKGITGALFMMDLDNFKGINDKYGHIVGDACLKAFASAILKNSKEEDIACRIGGDEFMIFVSGEQTRHSLEVMAASIITQMSNFFAKEKFDTNSSVSVGIAEFPEDGHDFKSLYNAADKALYYVKQNGKNAYHFFSDQHAAERQRAGMNIDLGYLRDIMKRTDPDKGAYLVDYDNFHHVYNFIRRMVERSGKDVQTVLFTLNGKSHDVDDVERAIEALECAVFNSLRRVDVSARYSNRQFVVVLMDTDEENGSHVADRILDNFRGIYDGNMTFDYDIVKM